MTEKPIHVWKFTLLSVIPFIGYYPFLKLKKTRKILVINIPIAVINMFVMFLINHPLGVIMSYTLIPLIDAIFVYHWAEEYNQQIKLF
jgi:hypothetical protein